MLRCEVYLKVKFDKEDAKRNSRMMVEGACVTTASRLNTGWKLQERTIRNDPVEVL
jgi:hypothetical protein